MLRVPCRIVSLFIVNIAALLPLVPVETLGAGREGTVCSLSATGTDYRTRDSIPWKIQDITRNHLDLANQRMKVGEYTYRVLADLRYILDRYPNFYPALEALLKYDLSGGKFEGSNDTLCYLENARRFVPDDINVLLYEGYFFWKKDELDRAKESYTRALALDPDSADAHYNIGLLYYRMKDFDAANAHAQRAYALGYPLPGLRNELKRSKHWEQTSTSGH